MENSRPSERKSGRAESVTSRRYYESERIDQKLKSFIETTDVAKPKNVNTKQSRHLPFWAWYIIAKCNGIPLKNNEKPIFGTILHSLTFAGALAYGLSYTWLVVYDILSPNTPQDIPGGTVSMILVFCWCAFGFYCKTLNSRLFIHPRFLKDIRMHSRTVFKINASLLAVILGALFTAANIIEALEMLDCKYCEQVGVDPIVCLVHSTSNIVFSVFTLIWHSLISFVFISVCRTHTIGLRRFIMEIEYDAAIFQHHHSYIYKKIALNADDIWEESIWMSEDDFSGINYGPTHRDMQTKSEKVQVNTPSGKDNYDTHPQEEISILFSPISESLEHTEDLSPIDEHEWRYDEEAAAFPQAHRMKMLATNDVPEDSSTLPYTMSSAEIMHHFWKLNCRLRFSSCALQRWFASFIALVLLRCSTYLVHWLGHAASVFDILQFVVPLIFLIVLSTALAEVNVEGQRVLRCLYPTETRLKMLQFLALNPLQMSIYGFGMTHGTIVTVIFAILVGFVTRIIITEMTK